MASPVQQTVSSDILPDLVEMAVNGLRRKALCIPVGIGSNAERDSGLDLPTGSIVQDVIVEVITAEATGSTKTLDVGLLSSESGGDADGFIDGVSVAAIGWFRGGVALDGGNAFFNVATRGAFMRHFVQGANADDRGLYAEFPHRTNGVVARSVSYSRGDTFVELSARIWVIYEELAIQVS